MTIFSSFTALTRRQSGELSKSHRSVAVNPSVFQITKEYEVKEFQEEEKKPKVLVSLSRGAGNCEMKK